MHPDDVIPFLKKLEKWGKELGIVPNFAKIKILTNVTGVATATQVGSAPTPFQQSILKALDYISSRDPTPLDKKESPEITTGVRFLGQPIGSKTFANAFLAKAAAKLTANLEQLEHSTVDRHTQSLLFRSCAIPSTHHLYSSDIYYN